MALESIPLYIHRRNQVGGLNLSIVVKAKGKGNAFLVLNESALLNENWNYCLLNEDLLIMKSLDTKRKDCNF